jgi:hypothetical protein
MFNKRWTSDTELSIHRLDADNEGEIMTLFSALRLFMTVLTVSLFWSLLGLTLYGSAVVINTTTKPEHTASAVGSENLNNTDDMLNHYYYYYYYYYLFNHMKNNSDIIRMPDELETEGKACGRCMWVYSMVRVCLLALSAMCMLGCSRKAYVYHDNEASTTSHVLAYGTETFAHLIHMCSARKAFWVASGAVLLTLVSCLFWCAVAFVPESSALHRCTDTVLKSTEPMLLVAAVLFIICDVSLLLAGTAFCIASAIMRSRSSQPSPSAETRCNNSSSEEAPAA